MNRLFLMLFLLLLSNNVLAFSSNAWKYYNNTSFVIVYNQDTEYLAKDVEQIANKLKDQYSQIYGVDIVKSSIAIVLAGDEEYENGSAYQDMELIRLETRKVAFENRGEHSFLAGLLAHEMSHIYSFRAMMAPLRIGIGFSTSDNKKPASSSVSFQTYRRYGEMPIWIYEGLSQYGTFLTGNDNWDEERELLLKDAYKNKLILTLDEMSRFEGGGEYSEMVYNQAFSFFLFLHKTNPSVKLEVLCKRFKQERMNSVFSDLYGRSLKDLYNAWTDSLRERFSTAQSAKTFETIKPFIGIDKVPFNKGSFAKEVAIQEISPNAYFFISNLNHDYDRFDLFFYNKQEDGEVKLKRVFKDVGRTLKCIQKDQSLVECWFVAKKYSNNKGVSSSELHNATVRVDKSNKVRVRQQTVDKRVLSFDVRDNLLVYASYNKGITTIYSKDLGNININAVNVNDNEQVQNDGDLYKFNYKASVDKISILNRDTYLLSLGLGTQRKLAILKNDVKAKQLELLFKEYKTNEMDGERLSNDSFYFRSNVKDGYKLYSANLKNLSAPWVHYTSVPNSVRFLNTSLSGNLFASQWSNGKAEEVLLNDYLKETASFDLKKLDTMSLPLQISEYRFDEEKNSAIFNGKGNSESFDISFETPILNLNYVTTNSLNRYLDNEVVKKRDLYIAPEFAWHTSSQETLIDFNPVINIPQGTTLAKNSLSFDGGFRTHVGKFIWVENFAVDKSYDEYLYDKEYEVFLLKEWQSSQLTSTLKYQVDLRSSFILRHVHYSSSNGYSFGTERVTLKSEEDINMLKYEKFSLAFNNSYYYSKFSPALFGDFGSEFNPEIALYLSKSPDGEFDDDAVVHGESATTIKFLFDHYYQAPLWSWGAFSNNLNAFKYTGEKNGKVAYGLGESIGGGSGGIFRGTFSYKARSLLADSIELKINPFAISDYKTYWYERFYVSTQFDFGKMKWLDGTSSINDDTLISYELKLNSAFYIFPERASKFYISYAAPIKYPEKDSVKDVSALYIGFVL